MSYDYEAKTPIELNDDGEWTASADGAVIFDGTFTPSGQFGWEIKIDDSTLDRYLDVYEQGNQIKVVKSTPIAAGQTYKFTTRGYALAEKSFEFAPSIIEGGSGGGSGSGSGGTVNSVNEIEPDSDGDVQLTYTYATQAEFEADEANIPIGAIVVKLYEE
ncbi:MAG: hypothetical protein LBO72_09635 [Helicobacteraceae bacterium]|jgi:hypothetical protein|nr:hypothetical protein [Helicobacteraceae bacterium]